VGVDFTGSQLIKSPSKKAISKQTTWPNQSEHTRVSTARTFDPTSIATAASAVANDGDLDLTEALDQSAKLKRQKKSLLQVVMHSPVAQLLLDSQFRIRTASTVFNELLGMPTSIILNTCFVDNLDKPSRNAFIKLANNLRDGQDQASGELILKSYHQGPRTVLAMLSRIDDSSDFPISINLVLLDISQQSKLESQLRKARSYLETLSNRDPLTNLPNRSRFTSVLRNVLLDARKDQQKVALLFLDIDKFKAINDQLGHHTGDLVLCEMAARLRRRVVNIDYVSRLGGDEFTMILDHIEDDNDVYREAEKLRQSIQAPIKLPEQEISISSSIGVCVYPVQARTPENLTRCADAAMYEAKNSGGNRFVLCSESVMTKISRRSLIEGGVNHNFSPEEFCVEYQPIVRSGDGKLDSIEILARWNHPTDPLKFSQSPRTLFTATSNKRN